MTTDAARPPARAGGVATPLALLFAALFVVSGACGLVYEVVWSRLLVHVFGVTAFAVSTVLVSFMGGLALGAALLGRRADAARRPLRMFAALEAGVGLYALALPLLLEGVEALHGALFPVLPDSFVLRSAFRFVLCAALLLVPTVLMGGTLPALGRGLLRRQDEIGLGIGVLYFVNTLGAAAGCWLAGFVLIPGLGLQSTTLVAFAGNATVAAAAWLLDLRAVPAGASPPGPAEGAAAAAAAPDLASPPSWPLWVAFGSGLTALAFEVVWFRVLVLVFGSTVYSFSAMLSVFLLGLAAGSILIGRHADRVKSPVRLLAATQAAVALCALAGDLAAGKMPALFLETIRGAGIDFEGMNRAKFALSFLTLFPPALAFGATFPVAVRLAPSGGGGFGARIGRVYAWNTVGAILGSFGTGFVLLPAIGAETTLKLVVGSALVLAVGSLLAEPGPLRLRWAVPAGALCVLVAAGLALAPPWDRRILGAGAYFEPRRYLAPDGSVDLERAVAGYRLTTFTEGYNETIISFRSPKGKFITVNGSTTASDQFEDMFSQRMLGHLPMALHPGPVRKACVVGLGAGVTTGAIGLYESERITSIELEKGVLEASRFFSDANHGVLDNPRVAVRIDDGRNFLALTRDRFDVISSAPNFPSLTGSGALYSVEFFELCRRRLAPGGVMCQFAPIWRLLPDDLRVIVRSFTDVFPHVRVFSTGLSLVMLGREEPFPPVDVGELRRRVGRPEVTASLAGIGVRGPIELLSFYLFDEAEAKRFAGGAERNTDDRPRVEFLAPRGVFADTVGPNLEPLAALRPPPEERRRRLGLEEGDVASSFEILASAYDAANDARILLWKGEVERAMETVVPAADAGQRYARFVVAEHAERVAMSLQRAGRIPEARSQYAAALSYEPQRLESLVGFGFTSFIAGDLDAAEAALGAAASAYPEAAGALYRLGLVREARGKPDEAEALYRKAIDLEPLASEPRAFLGRLLLAGGRIAEGLAQIEAAIRLGERTDAVYLARGEALLRLGNLPQALNAAREATRGFPVSVEAFDLLARVAEAAGRGAEAAGARARRDELRRQASPSPPPESPAGR